MPYYLNKNIDGLTSADSNGDGYSIVLKWAQAYPNTRGNSIAYNIYMSDQIVSDFEDRFFQMIPSFVSVDGNLSALIIDLTPGVMYHFGVRAIEYDPATIDFSTLPKTDTGLVVFPQSLLSSDITASDAVIPLIDAEGFPGSGVVKIGVELVNYSSVSGNNLMLTNVMLQRGYNGTPALEHTTDGYDGYYYWDPTVVLWPVDLEDQNTRIFQCWNRFDIGNYPFTLVDGYHQRIKDILNTDLTFDDSVNATFPEFSFSGYARTDPVLLLGGACVGSYFGGQQGCSDGYNGVGQMIRGISVDVQNNQRQEILLDLVGEPVVLMRRQWLGITCDCFLPAQEYPENRCNKCYGTGFVVGYQQYFNPRRSDGRIMVRFDPSIDSVKSTESGLESDSAPNCWTMDFSTIHNRDFIVRFDIDGNEEFRYEVLNVTRNKVLLLTVGAQRFAVQRIRKTDPIYQVKVFRDTSLYPVTIQTTYAQSLGIANHNHNLVISEKITSLSQINEITSISAGHSHVIQNRVVLPSVGHTHQIIL